jgi:ABC-2 type transport system permease protein
MKRSIIGDLIWKDCWLYSPVVILSMLAGAIGLAIIQIGGPTPLVIGGGAFFISLIFCASVLPGSNIVNERKKQTLTFLMSLPVSAVQYGIAKLAATVGMFLITWMSLVGVALWYVLGHHALRAGIVPSMLVLAMLPFIGFCMATATALVSESEGWAMAVVAITNSTYWVVWYFLASKVPEFTQDWKSTVLVWSPAIVKILAVECAIVVLILGLTLYLQSRKRDFV